jgi:hypothetical protein
MRGDAVRASAVWRSGGASRPRVFGTAGRTTLAAAVHRNETLTNEEIWRLDIQYIYLYSTHAVYNNCAPMMSWMGVSVYSVPVCTAVARRSPANTNRRSAAVTVSPTYGAAAASVRLYMPSTCTKAGG